MTKNDIEGSVEDDNISEIIISDDEEGLEDLRQMAILSMIKTENINKETNEISTMTIDDIERQLKECRENLEFNKDLTKVIIDKNSSFINLSKRQSFETSGIENKRQKFSDVRILVEDYVGKSINIEDFDIKSNLSKQVELKEKLIEILLPDDRKKNYDIISSLSNSSRIVLNNNDEVIKLNSHNNGDESLLKRYISLINENEKSVDEISRSIETFTMLIQEKLQKSKAISAQIENLKRHKIDLHKEINLTRSKILDLNKVKKQRIITGAKYKALRNKFEQSPPSSSIADKTDTMSTVSFESDEYCPYTVDCNQIVCSSWIDGTCTNNRCGYQHPKISSKPVTKHNHYIKENDKVFLPEMNPLGLITAFYCEACSSTVMLSNLHIIDDWHCKSCCQHVLTLQNPNDLLRQLINIWHHFYRRFILTQNISIKNRDETIYDSLFKCTDALKARMISSRVIDEDVFRAAGRHILMIYSECHRVEDTGKFLEDVKYNNDLVSFATTLPFPVPVIQSMINDVMVSQINKASFNNVEAFISIYCQFSEYVESNTLTSQLFQWLEMIVKMNVVKNHPTIIFSLTQAILTKVMGSNYGDCLTFSFYDLQRDEQYWVDRKDAIYNLVRLYVYDGDIKSNIYFVLNKYLIISLFYTDNEESAIELCQRFLKENFYFEILFSKLSLKYNYPMPTEGSDVVSFIEHSYNKAEWLLCNRSEKSCVKVLEGIVSKLYCLEDQNKALHYYEHFLCVQQSSELITSHFSLKISESERSLISKTSSIWMCYVTLMYLKENVNGLSGLLSCNGFFVLPQSHICRVIQLIFEKSPSLYEENEYNHCIKSSFLRIQTYISFPHFMDLFKSICWKKLADSQLSLWLFLVDFCNNHFMEENRAIFLTEMSSSLLRGDITSKSYDIFCHIVLCYPIKVEKVWLDLIELIFKMKLPLYTLIDVCGMAVSYVRSSKSLWRHYYNSALKNEDELLIKNIKERAEKIGFHFD